MGRHINLTLVRHGQTESNLAKLVQGRIDSKLTSLGQFQAELLGKHVASDKFTRIFCSDAGRAYSTAELILKHSEHPGPFEIVKDVRLREKCFGEMDGKPYDIFKKALAEHDVHWLFYAPEGGETYEEIRDRVKEFFMEICSLADTDLPNGHTDSIEQEPENILLVSHAGALYALMEWLHSSSQDHFHLQQFDPSEAVKVVSNTGTTRLTISPLSSGTDKRTLTFLWINDTSHLNNNNNC